MFQARLHGDLDLFLGDFNMTGLDRSGTPVDTPMTLFRTGQSTTITGTGPVPHQEGLDLVYAGTSIRSPGAVVDGVALGRAQTSVIPFPMSPGGTPFGHDYMYRLSDHRPVLVELTGL
ncbi:hypothetical protein [Mangrovicoccus ximenensis]|uniref:hypothetical protein n=1 Tax=Mangrovicoccus ximenensis TaxID=1911570 RepID=UPI0011AEB19F|nr:hypothetical protein [Mangrovicoccus ximenensis]